MPYLRQKTWLQTAPRGMTAVTWGGLQGMGIAPGDPGFVGPLTTDEENQVTIANLTATIANLTAGVQYRDALLAQSFDLGDFLKSHQEALVVSGIAVFGLALLGGRR